MAKENTCQTTANPEVCLEKFEQIIEAQGLLASQLRDMNKRLFYDNGSQCLQSKVNEHSRSIVLLMWLFGFIGAGQITIIGWLLTQARG